jgi:site-specific recombinase XerD
MSTTASTRLTIRPRGLTVEDLADLPIPIKVQDGFLLLEKSPKGWTLKEPVKVPLDKVLAAGERGLVAYILSAFISERSKLIPFIFENQTLIRLARHFLRHCSGSPMSLYGYTDTVSRYSRFLGLSPDMIIMDVKDGVNIPNPLRVQDHSGFLEDYLAALQDEGLSPGRVYGEIKHIRTFYRVNGAEVKLSEPLSRRVTYKDRAPTPEELTKLLEIADLREKVVATMLALGGFREETLAKLQYRHVREDIETGRTPIHVHVEVEITKGKYSDYDTFLGAEADEYLRLYLDQRRRGSVDGKIPPENLNDQSLLIRDKRHREPRPVGPKQIRKLVHGLYMKAGLLKEPRGRMYELRVHSLRKYFKTQLLALGVQESYVDYMMGHVVDTYHDIQSLGVEKLRNVYAASALSIRPKTRVSKIEALKEIIRAWGLNPEKVLTREALSQGATARINAEKRENHDLQVLSRTLRDLIRQEAGRG